MRGPAILLGISLVLLVTWLTTSYGEPRVESYAASVEDFRVRVLAEGHRPPPGDVFVLARHWEFEPSLELQAGQTYRVHLLAEDGVHSAVVGDTEVLLVPGTAKVVTVTMPPEGRLRLQCGEYCGLGHTKMIGSVEAVK